MHNQEMVHILYNKLLRLYPRDFKEQLGEAMEQTFNDLYNEQKRQTDRGLFGPMLWIFIETARGITKEYILLITQGDPVKNILTNLRSPTIVSFILVIPFMILELVNRRNFNEGFPIPLFVFMWLLPMLFILTVMPIVRNVLAGNSIIANPVILLLRVVFLAFIVWMWFGILIDQMPCFLGVPNCD
jgi:hypothetical protein